MKRKLSDIIEQSRSRIDEITDLWIKEGYEGVERLLSLKSNSVYKLLKILGISTKKENKDKRRVEFYRGKADRPKCRDIFSEGWSEFLAYFVGYMLGDGTVYRNKGRYGGWEVKITTTDKDVIEMFSSELGVGYSEREPARGRKGKKTLYILSCADRKLFEGLQRLGFVQNKSGVGMGLPKVPKEYFWDFIRGLQDSDGCVTLQKANVYSEMKTCIIMELMGHPSYMRELQKCLPSYFRGYFKYNQPNLYAVAVKCVEGTRDVYDRMYGHGTKFYMKRKKDVWDTGWRNRECLPYESPRIHIQAK